MYTTAMTAEARRVRDARMFSAHKEALAGGKDCAFAANLAGVPCPTLRDFINRKGLPELPGVCRQRNCAERFAQKRRHL